MREWNGAMNKELYMHRIHNLKKYAGLSDTDFIKAMGCNEKATRYYSRNLSRIISGEIIPKESILQNLAARFGVRFSYLIGDSSFKTESDLMNCEKKDDGRPKPEIISERIRNLKYEYELSNPQLAAAAGCSEKHVPRLLKGKSIPHDDILHSLAASFNVRYEYLSGNSPFPTNADIEEYNRRGVPDINRFNITVAYLKYLGFEFNRISVDDSFLENSPEYEIYFHGKRIYRTTLHDEFSDSEARYHINDLTRVFNRFDDFAVFEFIKFLEYCERFEYDSAAYKSKGYFNDEILA